MSDPTAFYMDPAEAAPVIADEPAADETVLPATDEVSEPLEAAEPVEADDGGDDDDEALDEPAADDEPEADDA